MDKNENFYTIPEVCKRYRVCRKTVYNWIYNGKIRTITTVGGYYRIPESALDEFERENRRSG